MIINKILNKQAAINRVLLQLFIWLNFGTVVILQAATANNLNHCLDCHQPMQNGFSTAHKFGETNCVICHQGDSSAGTAEKAHRDMYAFPGNLSNAFESCGACHTALVESVNNNMMHTATGMVGVTRFVFDEVATPEAGSSLQSLAHSPADSLLRKQCASCHLGQDKTKHQLNVTSDRGGGCLACHVNENSNRQHPQLTIRVQDGRCFGCHSRSGRISLSYAGLAEVDDNSTIAGKRLAKLDDGRLVEHKAADIHQQAGMACIDCHTSVGLMGSARGLSHQQQAVDIGCSDCHDNNNSRISPEQWPQQFESFIPRVPFAIEPRQKFLRTTRSGSPLWRIEIRDDGYWLYRKLDDRVMKIPQFTDSSHALQQQHARLSCASCHSQWAPQCNGCHLRYDAELKQWDHVEQKFTPGRWIEKRWGIDNDLPALGVDAHNHIVPFVPGMILTIQHPEWEQSRFKRLFASLSPHTSGHSRSCQSCHRSAKALGLGKGQLIKQPQGWQFNHSHETLQDGIASDAWISLEVNPAAQSTRSGDRPFNRNEIERILNAEMP